MSDDILSDLIEGEREELLPPRGAKKKTWRRVSSSVAMGAPLPADPTMVSTPMLAAKSALPWAKGLAVLALGGVVAVGAYVAGGTNDEQEAAPVSAKASASAPAPDPEPPRPKAAPRRPAAPESAPAVIPPTPVEPTAPPEPVDATVSAERPSTPAPETTKAEPNDGPSQLAEETRLIAEARWHLRDGSPRAALEPLADHSRRFPKGQLTEDRMALVARAHCEAGDVETGRDKAAALIQAYPASSHAARVARACKAD